MHIHTSTLSFFKDLKDNNDRTWFLANKERYDLAYDNIKSFIEGMIIELAKVDPQINTDIKASKCMFRIYRDVRFAKDKSPYKSWLAAGISVDGRKLEGPEYYIHIEPGKTFAAVGYWRPKKEHLDAIRQEIDYNFPAFEQALDAGGWKATDLSQEDKLVRPPAGYAADDPHIEVLKLKSFILYKNFTDEEISKTDSLADVIYACTRILPFKKFIHEAIEA